MLLLVIGWIATAVAGAVVGFLSSRVWQYVRRYSQNRRELRQYLSVMLSSDHSRHGPQPLVDILNRYPSDRYVVPWLRLRNGNRSPARDFLVGAAITLTQERLVVHGIFGSGKTALCLDLTRELARRSADGRFIWLKRRIVPVYVPLGTGRVTLTSGFSESLDQLLVDYGLRSFGGLTGLHKRLRPVLILDGFDQLLPTASPYQRVAALAEISHAIDVAALSAGSNPWILLTMRSDLIDVPDSPLLNALDGQIDPRAAGMNVAAPAFNRATLENLDDMQLIAYITRHARVDETQAAVVVKKLRSNVHASEWIRHPLLLNIFLTVGHDQLTSASPLNVARLYRSYAEYWFMNDSRLIRLGSSARRNAFVEDLATSLMQAEVESLPVEEIVSGGSKGEWNSFRQVLLDRSRVYQDSPTESFLLVNRDDTVMFSHRSFMEYFSARRALELFRRDGELPAGMSRHIYSNLIISFLRDSLSESDYKWVLALADHGDEYHRYLGYALMPMVVGGRPEEALARLRSVFNSDADIDVKRHALFGIGSLGADPCDAVTAAFLKANRIDWLSVALQYYRTADRQRLHCVHRLRSFELGNHAFFENRGLYIFDLGEVGKLEDIDLIEPYADDFSEHNQIIVEFATEAIRRIKQRFHSESWQTQNR